MNKNGFGLILMVMIMSVFVGCGPAAEAIKRGDTLREAKDHYGASKEYLNALNHESDNSKAKLKLCENAKFGYEQKLMLADGCEKKIDHQCALINYKELSGFVESVKSRGCLSFSTVNLKQKITEMNAGASETYYKDAEIFFNKAEYSNAISKYKKSLEYSDNYKDCKKKMAESNYKLAKEQVKNNNYRNASEYFKKANSIDEGYIDAAKLAAKYKNIADENDANENYQKGIEFAKIAKFREASVQFEKATTFVANYKDSQLLASKYKTKADDIDAQLHFENGMSSVKTGNFREATAEFEKANSFVSNFKDSQALSIKYKVLADEKDAQVHYENGKALFDKNDYAEATKEFLTADGFIKGYKDSISLAKISNDKDSINIVLNIDTPKYTVDEVAKKMVDEHNAEFFKVLMKQLEVENDYRVQNNILLAIHFYVHPDMFKLIKRIVDRGRTKQYDIAWPSIISMHGNICKANPDFETCKDIIPFLCKLYCFDRDQNIFNGVKRATYDVLQSFSWKKDYSQECIKMYPGCK